jgi:hypothetical protein
MMHTTIVTLVPLATTVVARAEPLPVPSKGGSCPHGYLWRSPCCSMRNLMASIGSGGSIG